MLAEVSPSRQAPGLDRRSVFEVGGASFLPSDVASGADRALATPGAPGVRAGGRTDRRATDLDNTTGLSA